MIHGSKHYTVDTFVEPSNGTECLTSFNVLLLQPFINIGIKHGFPCINIRQVAREVLKTEAGGRGFQHLPRDLANIEKLCSIAIIA